MKMVQKLSLLAMVLTLASCNEKVSPELQQGSATTPDTSTPVAPDEYYFALTNTSEGILNYKLHKTGSSNMSSKCEVRNTTGLSSDIFRGNPTANDITCYFDAEELSLFHGGFKWELTASKNTCDFIGYQPYGFYDRIPGDSTSTFVQISCMNDTTDNTNVATAAAALGVDITDATPTDLGCGDWAIQDLDITPAVRQKFQPASDAELCRFNYPDGNGEKCDIGTITINEIQVAYTPADGATPAVLTYQNKPRVIRCGGSVANCVQGPTKDISSGTRVIEIVQGVINEPFKKGYEYKSLNQDSTTTYVSTKKYANYRRNLASKNIDFISSTDPLYEGKWNSLAYGKTFDPMVVDFFSANLQMDNATPLISSARLNTEAIRNNTWRAKPLAADPFLGLAGRVNPFYTFYCYDTALDMKARMRIVVRDWDRIFPGNSDLELLSDIFRGGSARQDIPFDPELPEDNDPTIPFNDFADWDDHIPMERTPGAYSTSTIWSPTPDPSYLDGWFNPAYFTNNAY